MEPALREGLRSCCGWIYDDGYEVKSSVVYRQLRFLQILVIGSPLMNEVFTRELWLHSVVLHLRSKPEIVIESIVLCSCLRKACRPAI